MFKIILDKSGNVYSTVNAKQGDTLKPLEIEIYNNGIPLLLNQFSNIQLKVMRSDGNFVIQTTNMTITNNNISVNLIEQISECCGITECEIALYKDGKIDTSFTFYINYEPSVISKAISNKSSIDLLEELKDTTLIAQTTNDKLNTAINNGNVANMQNDIANLIATKTKYTILWSGDVGEASTTVPLQLSDDPANYNILIIRTYLSFIITYPTSVGGNRAIFSSFQSTSMTNLFSYDVYQGLRFEANNKVYVDTIKVLQRDGNGVGTVLSGDVAKNYGKITGIYGIKY